MPGHEERASLPTDPVQRLLAVHDLMRSELTRLRAAVTDGPMHALSGRSLRRYCVDFCAFVNDHHSIEDTLLFPAVCRKESTLGPAIERLMTEHRELVGELAEVERLMAALPGDTDDPSATAAAVERLSTRLETHLRFEEETLTPTLSRMTWNELPH